MKHKKGNSENFKTEFYSSTVGKSFGKKEREPSISYRFLSFPFGL